MKVPFLDLNAQLAPIRAQIDAAVGDVLDNTSFILGPTVAKFEERFAQQTGRQHCVGVNSGTSALHLALLASEVGPGDEVITTPHSWISTTWAISYSGATPVFVDIDAVTGNLDPAATEAAITPKTKALLPVDLYGNPAALPAFEDIASRHDLVLIEDAAQSHLATLDGRVAGGFGHHACFSFYPGKNLGAAGEGGAVVTDDAEAAARMRRLRDHAQERRHHHTEVGFNYRMEGLQGAVLTVKLDHLQSWTDGRRTAAQRYAKLLGDVEGITLPGVTPGADPAWHLYAVRVDDRDAVAAELGRRGIGTGVHYPTPIPYQPVYRHLGYKPGGLPNTEAFMASCLSLPMYAEIDPAGVEYVAEQLIDVVGAHGG